jgi:1-pyrroline-5-carboxylate dehydrogenase
MTTLTSIAPFKNEPFTNFLLEDNIKEMEIALAKVKAELGKVHPLHIGSEKIRTDAQITSINPGNVDEIIGYVSKADQALAEKAMQVALQTFENWKKVPAAERADFLFKAAALMREHKHEFSAMMVYEAGKNWAEADADTAEAIDFLEFYAHEAIRLSQVNEKLPLIKTDGEDNKITYIPLGVGS